jgi:hypothetical protein
MQYTVFNKIFDVTIYNIKHSDELYDNFKSTRSLQVAAVFIDIYFKVKHTNHQHFHNLLELYTIQTQQAFNQNRPRLLRIMEYYKNVILNSPISPQELYEMEMLVKRFLQTQPFKEGNQIKMFLSRM